MPGIESLSTEERQATGSGKGYTGDPGDFGL